MSAIADLKDGTFFFIEKLSMVDECFVDCLGSIITSVGQNVNIGVSSVPSEIFPTINFARGMGGNKIWTWNNSKTEFQTKVSKIVVGKSKDFILELNIPKCTQELDKMIELTVVNVVLTAEGFNCTGNVDIVKKTCKLKLKLFSDNLDEKEEEVKDEDLIINFFRLKLAETMIECKTFADNGKYEDAKKLLNKLMEELINSKLVENQKIKLLMEEIKIAIKDVQPETYKISGSHNLSNNMNCNLKQKSVPTNVNYAMYSNNMQQNMNFNVQMSKKK